MKLRPFELGLVIVFIGLALGALFLMATFDGRDDGDGPVVGEVTIWGVLSEEVISGVLLELQNVNKAYLNVSYREVADSSFNSELVNAIADGTGPDMVIISHDQLIEMRRRLQPVTYDSFPLRDVRDVYIDGAHIFALSDGLYAHPIATDPLVMFWNRDLVTTDGFLAAPTTWEALVNEYLPTLVRRNPDRSIVRGVVAMGEYSNVRHAFGMMSLLLLQAGTQGVVENNALYEIRLNQSAQAETEPLRVAADFYTRFGKPSNSLYSWNRSFQSDLDAFIGGQLVFYFGYASEGPEIERRNPNLNFDIAEVPQGAIATVRRTYGNFYGLAVVRTSDNLPGAAAVLGTLARDKVRVETIATRSAMVPAFRASVAAGSNDAYGRIAYKAAPIAYGWLSPSREGVDTVFRTMIDDINQNRRDTGGAVNDALGRLELEYNR